jgi:hypothetical protein
MTEVTLPEELSSILSSVDTVSKQLNTVSNDANQVIQAVDNRLLRANIGMEVWWDHAIMDADCSGELGNFETGAWARRLLGFAKVYGDWCLAVKTVRYVSAYVEEDPSQTYTTQHVLAEPVPLKRASRDVRLEALKNMPGFLAYLAKTVEKTVKELESTTQSFTAKKAK